MNNAHYDVRFALSDMQFKCIVNNYSHGSLKQSGLEREGLQSAIKAYQRVDIYESK